MRALGIRTNVQNSIINVDRVNQSASRNIGKEENQNGRFDSVSISKNGKASSIIETLTKQKADIEKRKNEFLGKSVEDGKSIDDIQARLDLYDEQIKDIDKQIDEIKMQQAQENQENNNENKTEEYQKQPKTKEKAENEKLESVTQMAMSLDKIDVMQSIKNKIDGDVRVLDSEIELDKSRGADAQSLENKENKLMEMEIKSSSMSIDIGNEFADIQRKNKEYSDNNYECSDESKQDENNEKSATSV